MMAWKWGVTAFAVAAGFGGAAQAEGASECAALAGGNWLKGGTVASASWVAADAAKAVPGYCEVKATLNPASGSNIGVVYRLPEKWNGKLLGLGGGGWAGNVRPET